MKKKNILLILLIVFLIILDQATKIIVINTINSILSSSFLFLKLKEIKNIIYE